MAHVSNMQAQQDVANLLAAAAALLRASKPAEAARQLHEATRYQPGNAAILHDLGLACLQCGAIADAIGALQGAIAAEPRYADAHLRLGIALEAAGALEEALASYRQAADIRPALADARFRAGNLLETLGRTGDAAQAFRRAAASTPKTTLGRIAKAKALLNENQDFAAQKVLRQALALDKGNAAALELLGQSLADAGHFDEARACLLRAIDASPALAGAYYDVARCRPIGPGDAALLERMRAALAWPGLEPTQRARVHLALGKAAADTGDYAEAMRHFNAAEQARDEAVRFDLPAFEAQVDRLISCFSADCIAAGTRSDAAEVCPVFIVGLPRSGTTLVEQILACHPDVAAGGELPFWNATGAAWLRAGGQQPGAAFIASAAADYTRLLRNVAPADKIATDKMPLNFQWAGLIHMAFPNATILHCRREPIDTAISIHQTHFNARMAFPTGGAALVGYMRAAARLCDHWRHVLPADRFIDIGYETLVGDPDPEIRRLVAACGLAWHDDCLHPERNDRVIKTPSKWQARQTIYRHAAGRWRDYEPYLGALRELLNDRKAVLF